MHIAYLSERIYIPKAADGGGDLELVSHLVSSDLIKDSYSTFSFPLQGEIIKPHLRSICDLVGSISVNSPTRPGGGGKKPQLDKYIKAVILNSVSYLYCTYSNHEVLIGNISVHSRLMRLCTS